MRNILLTLRFLGSEYHGWQLQNNAVTVQQKINEAVNCVLHEGLNVSGCSRTDSGVHAEMFCCNFRTEKNISTEQLIKAVNAYLPCDIAVYAAREVPEDFHARFSCKGKEYTYKIINSALRNPFYEKRAMWYPYRLDEELLNKQAADFVGTHDFSAFCSAGSSVSDTVRTVYSASVERTDELVEFKVRGNGFLYNMVRIMTGTLLDIACGKIEENSIGRIISSADRNSAGVTAPAHGLYLSKVFYEWGTPCE